MEKLTSIILAAGTGTRLKDITTDIPKSLVEINGRPLISYAINFLKKIGSDRIIVVGGYHYDKLQKEVNKLGLEGVEVYRNPDYTLGNLYSMDVALDYINSSFLLFHADHIYHKDIIEKVSDQCKDGIVVFTDNDRSLGNDDMKVLTDESGRILKKISKQQKDYNLGYVGMTYCNISFLDKYKNAVKAVKEMYGEKAVTENSLQYIADNNIADVNIGDISGFKWLEVDYPEELESARKEVSLNSNLYL